MARVLVACEYSGVVRDAFRESGHDAISCDLRVSEEPGPHIQGDVRPVLREAWDLVIAHPPCNYLSHINEWYKNDQRENFRERMVAAIDFFCDCYYANAPAVAVENPQPMRLVNRFLGPASDRIEPFMFGDAWKKRTWLWTRGLPPLIRGVIITNPQNWVGMRWTKGYQPRGYGKAAHSRERSRFFPGIARAMAEQWGSYVEGSGA